MRILWTEKKANEEIMEMAEYKRDIIINRADGLEQQILNGKICGPKSRRTQLTKYTV